MNGDRARRFLMQWFAVLTGLAWLLVIVGALVRAHGAGLSCPDWPLCKGELVPPFDAKVAFEWGHRVFAGSLSIGLLIGAVMAYRYKPLWARARGPILAAFAVFVVQAILGGLTVLKLLASWTVTSHLLCGNLFAATLLWSALSLRDAPLVRSTPGARVATAVAAFILLLQVMLGGLTSSQYAGLACTQWPACTDGAWFPTFQGLVGLHLLHRWNAMLVLVAYAGLFATTRRDPGLARLAAALLGLVVLQVVLGVANVLLQLPVEITALHSATASALFLLTTAAIHAQIAGRSHVALDTAARQPGEASTTASFRDALPTTSG